MSGYETGSQGAPQPAEADANAPVSPLAFWLSAVEKLETLALLAYAICLPITLTGTQVALLIGLGLLIIRLILCRIARRKPLEAMAPLTVPLLLLAGTITISGANNGYDIPGQFGGQSLKEAWKSLYSLYTILTYVWAYSVLRRHKNAGMLALVLLLWISAVAGVWGSIQQVFNIHPGSFKYLQGTGFHGQPMAFAGQMQVFSMLSLGLLLSCGYKKMSANCSEPALAEGQAACPLRGIFRGIITFTQKPHVFFCIVIANCAGLIFAGERSAWLGGIAAVLVLSLLKSWRFFAIASVGLFGAGGLAFCFVDLVRTRIQSLLSGADISVSVRLRIWSECLNQHFPRSPVFGIGWMKFPHFDIPEAIVPGVSTKLTHAHSNYIQFLTTTGVLGLASYLLLNLWAIVFAVKRFKTSLAEGNEFNAGIALGVLGAVVSLAVSGAFEFNFFTAQVRLAQWFVLALL